MHGKKKANSFTRKEVEWEILFLLQFPDLIESSISDRIEFHSYLVKICELPADCFLIWPGHVSTGSAFVMLCALRSQDNSSEVELKSSLLRLTNFYRLTTLCVHEEQIQEYSCFLA